jgi:hypothetical protein
VQGDDAGAGGLAERRRDQIAVVKPLAMQAGMMSETQLARFVDQHLPRKARPVAQQDPTRPQIRLDW